MSDRKENFKSELKELLKKYHAELSVEEIGRGDFKMIATFEAVISDDGNELLETYDELNLGKYVYVD